MPRIELKHVTKRWGSFTAVGDLNMVIDDRAFVTLLGPSGCGKTTTLRMIAGLETPTSGTIIIGDRVVFDSEKGINVSPDKRDIGFLFQNYALWPHMTVYQNITFGLENLKWKKNEIKERAQEMLKMLKIEEFSARYPSELSGGQQQRVAIARTLAPRPKVLFMDEPLSNLDAKLRSEMRTELKRLHLDTNSTFVYVTHDQLEAMTLATRVCLMKEGVLQQYDPPLTIYNRPENLFVADFVGNPTMNFIPVTAAQEAPDALTFDLFGRRAKLACAQAVELKNKEIVLGVRPEFLAIREDGSLRGTVHSTLPAGMETTVKINMGDMQISSVVFGSIDYPMDQPIACDIIGSDVLAFDKASGKRITLGAIEIVK